MSPLLKSFGVMLWEKINKGDSLRQEALDFLNKLNLNLGNDFVDCSFNMNTTHYGEPVLDNNLEHKSSSTYQAIEFLDKILKEMQINHNVEHKNFSIDPGIEFLNNSLQDMDINSNNCITTNTIVATNTDVAITSEAVVATSSCYIRSSDSNGNRNISKNNGPNLLFTKHLIFKTSKVKGDGNCLFRCFNNKNHRKIRLMLKRFLSKYRMYSWLQTAFVNLDVSNISLNEHIDSVETNGRFSSFF